jgi:hypothetical protein
LIDDRDQCAVNFCTVGNHVLKTVVVTRSAMEGRDLARATYRFLHRMMTIAVAYLTTVITSEQAVFVRSDLHEVEKLLRGDGTVTVSVFLVVS